MLNKFKTLSLSFLFLMFVLAWGTTTAFAAETTIYNPSFVMTANGEDFESDVTDSETTIDIECEATRGSEHICKVTFSNKQLNHYFYIYITVSNHTIIKVSKIYNTNSHYSVEYTDHPRVPGGSVFLCFKITWRGFLGLLRTNYLIKLAYVIDNYPYINIVDSGR